MNTDSGNVFVLLATCLLLAACMSSKPRAPFNSSRSSMEPDYSDLSHWAAHPSKKDSADCTPLGLSDKQNIAQADVFFLYPTSYFNANKKDQWNADINDHQLNNYTEASSILYQASIFNEVGRVFAPHYRQAHIYAFYTKDQGSAQRAFDLAYGDIKKAFEHYMTYENNNRPIILAGHSQGSKHMIRLLQEYFDGTPLAKRLVVAYAVGYPVPSRSFRELTVCEHEYQTGCICSWRTFKRGYNPKSNRGNRYVFITNPLSWKTNEEWIPPTQNLGSVLFDFYAAPKRHLVGSRIKNNILWINKPKFKGSFFYWSKNYHRGDYNLFYVNVRENAYKRLNAYWKQ